MQFFKNMPGPLFQFMEHTPVTYALIREKLRLLIRFLGLDPSRYTPHIFMIGAASSALMDGHSEDMIRKMGRWNSAAVKGTSDCLLFSYDGHDGFLILLWG